MTIEQRNEILENAYIPQELWDDCFITEDGMIHTPRFYEDGHMEVDGETAYQEWLASKDNPTKPLPTTEEKVDALIPVVEYHDEDIAFQGEMSLDIDYRLTLIEMSVNINTLKTIIGDDEMAAKPNSTTYRNAKKQIERGNYEYEEMLTMLDTFLVGNRITQEEYQELKDLMDSQQK